VELRKAALAEAELRRVSARLDALSPGFGLPTALVLVEVASETHWLLELAPQFDLVAKTSVMWALALAPPFHLVAEL